MNPEEVEHRFQRCEPTQGVAFLRGDPVDVIVGPHRGARGEVVGIRSDTPEATYEIRLDSGASVHLSQGELVGAASTGALAELQRWYAGQCDGDWEHEFGLEIGTLDNPGWTLTIQLRGTNLENAAFEEVKDLDPVRAWIHCLVKDGKFEGRGGPHMLERMIRVFLNWADEVRSER